jgi:GNAT superfamily N-acetyltransferase
VSDRLVISNLKSLIEISGSLDGSRLLVEGRGFVACDSGTGAANENYALLIPDASCNVGELIGLGLDFFRAHNAPHIWPLFPGLPKGVRALLERSGARLDDTFFGMTAALESSVVISSGAEEPFGGRWVDDARGVKMWADAVWYGFDSGEPAPEPFKRFVSRAVTRDEISIFGLCHRDSGVMAATGLLCVSDGTAGIYYISTRPEFRRKGLGMRVMEALLDGVRQRGCTNACLLATPVGRPLYLKCGFKETCRVPIMIYEKY